METPGVPGEARGSAAHRNTDTTPAQAKPASALASPMRATKKLPKAPRRKNTPQVARKDTASILADSVADAATDLMQKPKDDIAVDIRRAGVRTNAWASTPTFDRCFS